MPAGGPECVGVIGVSGGEVEVPTIAGKTVRAVLESVGVKDVLSKSLGSKNAANVVKATLKALQSLRLRETIFKARGLEIKKSEPAVAAA